MAAMRWFCAWIMLLVLTGSAEAADDPATHAKEAWDALVRTMAVPNQPGLFYDAPDRAKNGFVWGHGQIVQAALDLALLTGRTGDAENTLRVLQLYELRGAYAPTIHPFNAEKRFWDDNAWVLLALEQAMNQSRDKARYVRMLETTWNAFIVHGQAPGGGMYWREDDPTPQRGLPATGPLIEAALRLHLATGQPNRPSPYRTFAEFNDRWVETHLRAPEGYYWGRWYDDPAQNTQRGCHPSPTPPPPMNVCEVVHTTNQGTKIGADVLFFRVDGDRSHLDRAAATADAALAYFTPERLWREPPSSNAIFFRNLMVLDHFRPDPRYRAMLRAYMDRVWREARNPATGLFTEGGIARYGGAINSLDQAGIVQLFVLLALPPERIVDLT